MKNRYRAKHYRKKRTKLRRKRMERFRARLEYALLNFKSTPGRFKAITQLRDYQVVEAFRP